MADKLSIWTVGHSTLSIEDFIAQLKSVEIELIADVRSYPGSRRYPHFNKENLSVSLVDEAVGYEHLRELGGRRRARPDSLNLAWRNESFRGYADYMETTQFGLGIERLLGLAHEMRVAIMCSEAVWWRCHRSMISDQLKVKGIEVLHIMGNGKTEPHPFTAAARVVNGELSYRRVERVK